MESQNNLILLLNTAPVLILLTSRWLSGSKPTSMNKNQILKSDILDIIFDGRNKTYGAYELRKLYPHRIKKSILAMFALAAAFYLFTLLPESQKKAITRPFDFVETKLTKVVIEPEKPPSPVEPDKPASGAKQPVNQRMFINNLLIVSEQIKTDSIKTITPDELISNRFVNLPQSLPPLVQPVPPVKETGNDNNDKPKINKTVPLDFDAVDVPPVFPGGMDALSEYLRRHLQNPYDLENGETVLVQVKFVVGYNGKLQQFKTIVDGGEIYNNEVIRVLKKMPEWIPGKAKGENVAVYYTIPVKFVMSN